MVISSSPKGPLGETFVVLIAISEPKPISPPSLNLVEAFTVTAEELTFCTYVFIFLFMVYMQLLDRLTYTKTAPKILLLRTLEKIYQ